MTFLSPKTHTYIKYLIKWIYIWDSSTQSSGFTHFDSSTQPSGFTYLIKSLHDWILQFYIIGLNMTFSSNYKYDFLWPVPERPQEREILFQNHHNANNALRSARLMLPLKMCIQASFPYDQGSSLACATWNSFIASYQQQSLHDLSLSLNHKTSISSMCEKKEYSSSKSKQVSSIISW